MKPIIFCILKGCFITHFTINKIDLIAADVERSKEQIETELGLDSDMALLCSAKEGTGIQEILDAVTVQVPSPAGNPEAPLSALIFDANYDSFRGTIVSCRVFEGVVRPGDVSGPVVEGLPALEEALEACRDPASESLCQALEAAYDALVAMTGHAAALLAAHRVDLSRWVASVRERLPNTAVV